MMFPRLNNMFRFLLPRTVRAHRIMGGPLRGSRIVTSWRDYPAAILGITEPQLLQWFATTAKPGETWLDVGAHYGYTALALSQAVGGSGRVFAFEPMLETVGHIARTRALNGLRQLTIIPMALGDVPGLRLNEFQTTRGMVDNTLTTDMGAWKDTLLETRLDDIWPSLAGEGAKIDGIKIDVQGMELPALRGMAGLLRRWHPKLVVEVHCGVSRSELLQFLSEAGYDAAALPVEPVPGETAAQFLDDRSYAFSPRGPA